MYMIRDQGFLAVFVLCLLSNLVFMSNINETKYVCNISSNNGRITNCTFTNHETTLYLNCSDYVNGRWFKNDSDSQLCQSSLCSITNLGYVEASGIYYCQTGTSSGRYYVNVNIRAPPEYLPIHDSLKCDGQVCYYREIIVENGNPYFRQINIAVKVTGVGPFNVTWYHNTTSKNACTDNSDNGPDDSIKCIKTVVNEKETIFKLIRSNTQVNYKTSVSGYYISNVSNPYGSNISQTLVQIQCSERTGKVERKQPNISPMNKTFHRGHKASFLCSGYMNENNQIGICYLKKGDNISSVFSDMNKFNNSCAVCFDDNEEECEYQIPNKPLWTVRRFRIGDYCENLHAVQLDIESVHGSDSGHYYCIYRFNNYDEHGTFGEYNIKVTGLSTSAIAGITVGLVVVFVLLLVSMVTFVVKYKRRRRKNKEERSLKSVSDVTEDSGYVPDDDKSLSEIDSIYQGLLEQQKQVYGSIPHVRLDPKRNSEQKSI